MDALITVYYVIAHIGLVAWATFATWYGVTRKWNENPYGINIFLMSAALAVLFAVMVSGIWWQGNVVRTSIAIGAVAILAGLGIQRISWLRKRED